MRCQTLSETLGKRRAAAPGGHRSRLPAAGSLHRASTTWGQRETASFLHTAQLGGSSAFSRKTTPAGFTASSPPADLPLPIAITCPALAGGLLLRAALGCRGHCSMLQSPIAKLCCSPPPPSSRHCTAVLHFPLHLSFPFPGCAVLGSQLCSQGTPQSSKDQEGHSALACSQHCCSENITREQSGPALKFPCGCGKHQHSISQYNAMLLYRLMLPAIRDTAAVLGH